MDKEVVVNTHDDDTDPTGMRALLRGLPDPGPMPDDLVDRIHASLGALPAMDSDASAESDTDGVSRGTTARPSWWIRHGSRAAIAAVVLIGGGAVASGPLGLFGAGDSGNDTSTAADSSAGQAETFSESDADASTPTPGSAEAQGGRAATLGAIVVRQSARAYTAAGLSTQLGSAESAPTTSTLTAEAPGIGPIGTEIGVRSCLEALGLARDSAADVDLASLDGTPAAILVVTLEGERTAYAVGRDCTTGNPALLAGPVTLP